MIKLSLFMLCINVVYVTSFNVTKEEVEAAIKKLTDGANLMNDVVNIINDDEARMDKIIAFAIKIGTTLGPVGPAFALIGAFLLDTKDPTIQFIQQGFDKLHLRFDVVDRRLNEILDAIDRNIAYDNYKDNQDLLREVLIKYQQYLKNPDSNAAKDELKNVCKEPRSDPHSKLSFIYEHVTRQQMEPQLLPSMLKDSKYNRTKFVQSSAVIMADATTAAFLRQVCLSIGYPKDVKLMQDNADEAQEKITAIATALFNARQDLKNNFAEKRLELDLVEKLEEFQNIKDNMEVAKNLKSFLSGKYDFFSWGVHISAAENDRNKHQLFDRGNGYHKLLRSKSGRNVVVNWSNKTLSNTWNAKKTRDLEIIEQFKKPCVKRDAAVMAYDLRNRLPDYDIVLVIDPKLNVGHAEDENTIAISLCSRYVAIGL